MHMLFQFELKYLVLIDFFRKRKSRTIYNFSGLLTIVLLSRLEIMKDVTNESPI